MTAHAFATLHRSLTWFHWVADDGHLQAMPRRVHGIDWSEWRPLGTIATLTFGPLDTVDVSTRAGERQRITLPGPVRMTARFQITSEAVIPFQDAAGHMLRMLVVSDTDVTSYDIATDSLEWSAGVRVIEGRCNVVVNAQPVPRPVTADSLNHARQVRDTFASAAGAILDTLPADDRALWSAAVAAAADCPGWTPGPIYDTAGVLADWLEDRGDPRCERIRLSTAPPAAPIRFDLPPGHHVSRLPRVALRFPGT